MLVQRRGHRRLGPGHRREGLPGHHHPGLGLHRAHRRAADRPPAVAGPVPGELVP